MMFPNNVLWLRVCLEILSKDDDKFCMSNLQKFKTVGLVKEYIEKQLCRPIRFDVCLFICLINYQLTLLSYVLSDHVRVRIVLFHCVQLFAPHILYIDGQHIRDCKNYREDVQTEIVTSTKPSLEISIQWLVYDQLAVVIYLPLRNSQLSFCDNFTNRRFTLAMTLLFLTVLGSQLNAIVFQ